MRGLARLATMAAVLAAGAEQTVKAIRDSNDIAVNKIIEQQVPSLTKKGNSDVKTQLRQIHFQLKSSLGSKRLKDSGGDSWGDKAYTHDGNEQVARLMTKLAEGGDSDGRGAAGA